MKKYCILIVLIALSITGVFAQTSDSVFFTQTTTVAEDFNIEVATNTYLNSISIEEKAMSDKYFEGSYWHILWGLIVEIIVATVFLFFGLSKWMRKISLKVKNINLQNLIYIGLYIIFTFVLTLPYSIYVDFIREHKFDLSNLTFSGWFKEELIGLAINLVLLSILLLFIYFAIRKTKERWWIWAGGISAVFIIIVIFMSPVFINPLFNNYSELSDSPLKTKLLSMARANSIPTEHVYQFDASKQSKRVSANVSGIGNTIRISLNDNLLNRCNEKEICAVMAHEMGHYVLSHTQKFVLIFSLMFFVVFWLCNITFNRLWRRWGERWNITGISDISGLPLLMVILSFYMFLATPIYNNIIRTSEVEADIFGLNAAREPDAFASVIMMTSEYRKTDPGKWEEIIFYDHPSPRSRINMTMRWKAENMEQTVKDQSFNKIEQLE